MTERQRTVSEADLWRLKSDREDADTRYNAALTALDAAIQRLPDLPHPPPPPDETQVTPLNTRWQILTARPPAGGGWRGRLGAFIWSLVEPVLAQQESFNAALVDHLNRNITPQREVAKSIASAMALMQQQIEGLIAFQSRLVVYLQQVTPYVDTKDHELAAIARRITEDTQQELDRVDRMARGLAGAISGVSDEMLKRWESLVSRDQRYSGRMDDLRGSVAAAQQQVAVLKREFERLASAPATSRTTHDISGSPVANVAATSAAPAGDAAAETSAWKYVGFEDLFRGSRDEIRARQETYLPLFAGASDVLDIGCGRGEFLDLLHAHGISARGCDLNHEMVEVCRARGLDVTEADALSYLQQQPDASLGGLMAAQVVEHLEPSYLLHVLEQAQRVLRPGAVMVLETINAACWLAFFESYIRDLTHVRPLHPDTLRYLVQASGFADTEVRFAAPVDPANRLQPLPRVVRQQADPQMIALADTFDGNMDRLNRLMFTHMDYAVIARRP